MWIRLGNVILNKCRAPRKLTCNESPVFEASVTFHATGSVLTIGSVVEVSLFSAPCGLRQLLLTLVHGLTSTSVRETSSFFYDNAGTFGEGNYILYVHNSSRSFFELHRLKFEQRSLPTSEILSEYLRVSPKKRE